MIKTQPAAWYEAREFVITRVGRLLAKSDQTKPPFDPDRIAPLQRIKGPLYEDLGKLSGMLVPQEQGFLMKLNALHSRQRQRFSCAHEIVHSLFFEQKGAALIEKVAKEDRKTSKYSLEETLCNIGASELLMPSQIFKEHACLRGFHITSLRPLAHTFDTSIEATAIKLSQVSPETCCAVFWTQEESQRLEEEQLPTNWSTTIKGRMTRGSSFLHLSLKSVGIDSSILEAERSDYPTYAQQRFDLGWFRGPCDIQSQGFGRGSYRYVISLIFPEVNIK